MLSVVSGTDNVLIGSQFWFLQIAINQVLQKTDCRPLYSILADNEKQRVHIQEHLLYSQGWFAFDLWQFPKLKTHLHSNDLDSHWKIHEICLLKKSTFYNKSHKTSLDNMSLIQSSFRWESQWKLKCITERNFQLASLQEFHLASPFNDNYEAKQYIQLRKYLD